MFTVTILFNVGPTVEYRCSSIHGAHSYAKRIANGREILAICQQPRPPSAGEGDAMQTIPGFNSKIRDGASETKYQSRTRNDLRATECHYKRRVAIDRMHEAKALANELKEVWE